MSTPIPPASPANDDVEKGIVATAPGEQQQQLNERTSLDTPGDDAASHRRPSSAAIGSAKGWYKAVERTLVAYNLEARGIQRVAPSERHSLRSLGYSQIAMLWFSVNLAANNVALGMLGPASYSLGFADSCACAVLGAFLGCVGVAYIATFGPRSGNRTMVVARYVMGWWPAKLVVLLNVIVLLGYAMIDCVVAGQILSAVSGAANISVIVGIVIVAVVSWVITTFGYAVFHYYERYAWLPQLVVLSILAGCAGPHFDLSTPSAISDARTLAGNRLSFFSLCLAAAITYAGGAADYFVYYPESTPSLAVFAVTVAGLVSSFAFAFVLGIGLATGIAATPAWSSAYATSQGALVVAGFAPLGEGFAALCGAVVALGLIANLIVPTYSSGVDFQILGRACARVPRVVWNTVGVVIYTVCAAAGRAHLAEIFTNFLALMGYWVCIWLAITLEEHLIFRRGLGAWDWERWGDAKRLPLGVAALVAFLVGWAGAILSMAQVWYIGPIAKTVGEYGADMGNYVGFAWAAVVFPPLRWWEIKRFAR